MEQQALCQTKYTWHYCTCKRSALSPSLLLVYIMHVPYMCICSVHLHAGSVLVDLTFWPPAAATVDDISKLTSAVTSKAADFFATPELIAAYGAPQVVGTPIVKADSSPWGLSSAVTLGVGIGVGVGGALLIGVVVGMFVVNRRRMQTLTPRGQA